MTQRHLSTPAPADPQVLFEAAHSLRILTLNRPGKQNVLNTEMVAQILPQLEKWEESPLANVILFKGTGKNFCAGGDVKALVEFLDDKATWGKASEFFQQEYTMDAFIAKMKKPVVSIMQGNTMGGGIGISVHAPFRIATETTVVAMPETSIGLFPDVGTNFFLSRLDGHLGTYLGLTGDRLRGADAFFAGFASHYVPSERLAALEARLAELPQEASLDDVNSAIDEFAADANDLKLAIATYSLVGAKRRAIDVIFGRKTAEEILEGLKELEEGTLSLKKIVLEGEEGELEGLKAWAKTTREKLEFVSPTSVKLSLLAIREGKKLDIEEAFLLDLRLATACCNPELHPDFKAGVTNLLVTKSPLRAPWSPSTLPLVLPATLTSTFFSSPPPFSNPPLTPLSFRHSGPAFKSYPHARFSLPSEKEIQDWVTGEAKGSGDHALTRPDLINKVGAGRGGKVGVREKVDEVIRRKCEVGADGYLKWRY